MTTSCKEKLQERGSVQSRLCASYSEFKVVPIEKIIKFSQKIDLKKHCSKMKETFTW